MIAAKLKRTLLVTAALLFASGGAWAAPGGEPGPNPNAPGIAKKVPKPPRAPEIDASSGVSALALLAGVILLLREKSRPRDL
jgi:hypothetical protein